jgi:hypothetical protein
MIELVSLVDHFGVPAVVTAAIVYIVLRSDIHFIYPRKKR